MKWDGKRLVVGRGSSSYRVLGTTVQLREDESLNYGNGRGDGYGRTVLRPGGLKKETTSLQSHVVQSCVTLHCVG